MDDDEVISFPLVITIKNYSSDLEEMLALSNGVLFVLKKIPIKQYVPLVTHFQRTPTKSMELDLTLNPLPDLRNGDCTRNNIDEPKLLAIANRVLALPFATSTRNSSRNYTIFYKFDHLWVANVDDWKVVLYQDETAVNKFCILRIFSASDHSIYDTFLNKFHILWANTKKSKVKLRNTY